MDCVGDAVDHPTKHSFNVSETGVAAQDLFDAIRFSPDYVVCVFGSENDINTVEEALRGCHVHCLCALAERDEVVNIYVIIIHARLDVVVQERGKVRGQRCFIFGCYNPGS